MLMQWIANRIDHQDRVCSLKRPGANKNLQGKTYKTMSPIKRIDLLNMGLEQSLHRHNENLKDTANNCHLTPNNNRDNKESN
jgi:hypothetical protein